MSPLRYIKRLGFGKMVSLCFIDLIIRWNRVGLITERELMSFFLTIDSVLGDVSNLDVSRVGVAVVCRS